jgi:hypothetical protein
MNSRTEAIEYLKAAGLDAGERNWALGETIWIGALPYEASQGIRLFSRSAYIYPRNGQWSIFGKAGTRGMEDERCLSLREACDEVIAFLSRK